MGMTYLRWQKVNEATGWDFWRWRFVENFEVVFRIRDFNYLFLFLFFDNRLGWGGFLGYILER